MLTLTHNPQISKPHQFSQVKNTLVLDYTMQSISRAQIQDFNWNFNS